MCGVPRHYAVTPAVAAALLAFQQACQCLPIKPKHTRRYLQFVEVAHLGVFLKLANDISLGCGLNFWATALGKLPLGFWANFFLYRCQVDCSKYTASHPGPNLHNECSHGA